MPTIPTAGNTKRILDIGLTKGVNKKRDQHQLSNGELITAENVIFTNVDGQLCKRNGYAAVTPQGAAFQGGPFKAIGCRDNVEPLVLGQNTLNRYNPATNLSTSLPTPSQARLETQNCAASSGKANATWPPSHASSATDGSSYICLTWEEQTDNGSYMFYGVQDLVTGNWIISPKQIQHPQSSYADTNDGFTYSVAWQCAPTVRYANGYFYIYWLWTGSTVVNGTYYYSMLLAYASLPITNLANGLTFNSNLPSVFKSSGSTGALSGNNNAFTVDGHFTSSRFFISMAFPQSANNIRCFAGTYSGATLNIDLNRTIQNGSSVGNFKLACRLDSPGANNYMVATSYGLFTFPNASATETTVFSLARSLCSFTPVDIAFGTYQGYSVCFFSCVVVDGTGLSFPNLYVVRFVDNLAVTSITAKLPINTYFCDQQSKLFTTNVGNKFYAWYGCGSVISDAVYNAMYLIEFDIAALQSYVVSRTLYLANFHVCLGDKLKAADVIQIPGTQRYITFQPQVMERQAGTFLGYGALTRVLVDFNPARMPQMMPLPTGGVLVAGGYPLYYDGNDVVEAGFSVAPDFSKPNATVGRTQPSLPVVANSANTVLSGGANTGNASGQTEYYFVACFVRRDSYGNVYRSAPSSVYTAVCPNAGNSVTFPPLTYTGGGNVQVEFYRTTKNAPGTFYRCGVVANGAQYAIGTVNDTSSRFDTTLTAQPTIYTNSGELPNDPPPAIHHIALSEQRGFLIPADNRNVVWYSKQFSPGRTVEWCANLTLSEGLNSGQFEGLAVMDSFLIVFKKNQILYTTGNGPDNTGANGGFAPFQKIASDVGCIEAASIAVIPDGVVFKSYRGIELLTRGLQLVYIGENVESLVTQNGPLSSIVMMPNFMELRFIPAKATNTITNPDGTTTTVPTCVLTYDYGDKRWSTQTNMAAVQAVNINNDYYFISADGALVHKETPGKYLDNGTPITMTLETPEIPVGSGGIQGWGRAYRMALLGDFFSAHTLTIQFAYDHSPTYTDAVTFNTASGLISGETVEQFRLSRLPRSTMQTLKIKISDSGQSGLGQSCAISDLLLEVGDKNGLARLPGIKTL